MTYVPLSVPEITEEDISAVTAVLRSGRLVQGEQVEAFEREVSDYLGVAHAIMVSNGTASLHLALLALGIGPGDEVIVPAFSYVATANVVELVGAKCVFADVQRDTFNLDPAGFEAAIGPRTKAVVPVHEFGLACDIGRIVEIATGAGIAVIEDAACALGATEGARYAGTFGNIGSFSLHPRKAVTSGEGGIVTTDDDALAAKVRILRNHGIEQIDGRVEFVAAGLNYRMTDFQAALVRGQFARIEPALAKRRTLADKYLKALRGDEWLSLPAAPPNKQHTWQTFHPVLDAALNRDDVIAALRQQDIGCNYGAQCIPSQSYFQKTYRLDAERLYPNAWRAWKQGIALPLYAELEQHEVGRIVEGLRRVVGEQTR